MAAGMERCRRLCLKLRAARPRVQRDASRSLPAPLRCAGLYAAALMLLYYAAQPVLARRAAAGDAAGWLLEILVCQAVLEGVIGAHIVSCLGAAWLPWLLVWEAWCGLQCVGMSGRRTRMQQAGLVVALSVALPAAAALWPFHASALALQSALFEQAPWLAALPSAPRLLLPSFG